jgi:hypothetical protein
VHPRAESWPPRAIELLKKTLKDLGSVPRLTDGILFKLITCLVL